MVLPKKRMILCGGDKTHEKLPSMQRVKSTYCKVNLGLVMGDETHAVLFLEQCHMLHVRRGCIGQLNTKR